MTVAVIAAVASCLAFAASGPYLARKFPPAVAVRLLVPAAVLAAGCAVFVLGTVAFTWLGQLTEVAEYGSWSPRVLRVLDPIPPAVAVIAGALLLAAAVGSGLTAIRTAWALLSVHRACRDLTGVAGSPIVVVDSEKLDAFTTPGIAGRIVVTTGLLAVLDPGQRRALLAHEQSHRVHRHSWWILVAEQAAAGYPLLRPTVAAIRHATERWADEDAAHATDRRLLAATIARIALLRSADPAGRVGPAAAATGGQVPRRVQALLHPAPRVQVRHLGLLVVVTLAVLATGLAVEHSGELLFEHAEHAVTGTSTRPVSH